MAQYSLVATVLALTLLGTTASAETQAISFGASRCGRLEGGTAVLCSGPNFAAFSSLACQLGRNYLHPLVAQTIVDAYASLQESHPRRVWQFGDLGWKKGGRLRPHRTHRNGRSADFFFPVDRAGYPARVPISIFNKFGYGLDFDDNGQLGELTISWEALADHLAALRRAGRRHGVKIQRVILAPSLRRRLLRRVPKARKLRALFNKRQAWVRHDEHYHVDFDIPPRFKRPLRCREGQR
jgi:penicillin-insensitive murein endopeptidase